MDITNTRVIIHADEKTGTIDPRLYGQFIEHLGSCTYGGIWVGPDSDIPNVDGIRMDVVDALKKIKIPVIRWPGGCFADEYRWEDGIGPRNERPTRANLWWGGEESNAFGTHEFIQLCEMLGAEPYLAVNLGSGTPRELLNWTEYLNYEGSTTLTKARARNGHPEPFGVRLFGIGNESWGCGGNMTPQYYANEYAKFATFVSSFTIGELGNLLITKIASGANGDDYDWTRKFFEGIKGKACGCKQDRGFLVNGFAFHYYAGTAGTATSYSDVQWYELLSKAVKIEEMLVRHRQVMDEFDPQRRIQLMCDEFGSSHQQMYNTPDPSKKFMMQNTIRDALVAALTLDIFNRHADKITMANIAQMVNVGHELVLTDGPRTFRTPTYWIYEMYAPHQGGMSLPVRVEAGKIHFDPAYPSLAQVAGSCSVKGNQMTLSLVNTSATDAAPVSLDVRGVGTASVIGWRELACDDIHAYNTFDEPDTVTAREKPIDGEIVLEPASVNVLTYILERR
jgi:alpha-N-arabinofuranosidase